MITGARVNYSVKWGWVQSAGISGRLDGTAASLKVLGMS